MLPRLSAHEGLLAGLAHHQPSRRLPLLVLADVEDDGVLGDLAGGHGRDLLRHHAAHRATGVVHGGASTGPPARCAARMAPMSTPAPPVRDPAWSLSRSAIGLWVTESVIGTLVYGALVAVFVRFVPDGGPVPVLRWLLPTLLAVYAVTAIGV